MDKRTFLKICGITGMGLSLGTVACTSSMAEQYAWDRNWMWLHEDLQKSDEQWKEILSRLRDAGITGILIGGDIPMYEKIIPLAEKYNIDVHAWMWTLNRPGDTEAQKHPDWYTVSRKGDSCYDVHPYVDYYQWVCPSKEEVYLHIEKQVKRLSSVKGLKGIHLDYVRYSDVILAKALQPLYDIVQDKEYPEYDFCYCQTCRDSFFKESGIDVYELDDPTQSVEWRQYRYDSVTRLVNRLVNTAHNQGKLISAAVFPYPDLARFICRQSWDDWNLDAFFPMVYQNFYDEDMAWIKSSVQKGVKDLKGRAPLISGLYLPEIPDGQFSRAVENSFEGGARGVALFDLGSFENKHFDIMKSIQ